MQAILELILQFLNSLDKDVREKKKPISEPTSKPTDGYMRVSDKGLVEITEHEGIVLKPYRDVVGVWTVGVGHTAPAGGVDPSRLPKNKELSIEEVFKIFRKDISKFEKRVNDAVKVPLTQHQFDALVSFDFNTGGIYRANLTKLLNRKDYNGAGKAFMGWKKPASIIPRRTAEMNLFLYGNYDRNGNRVSVWNTNNKGKLQGIDKTLTSQDILKQL